LSKSGANILRTTGIFHEIVDTFHTPRDAVSKHQGRKQRWTQETPTRHVSALGRVLYEQNAWYGVFEYRTRAASSNPAPTWTSHARRLGPYKRPRNAMIALEEEITILRNRHGTDVLIGGELWAEAEAGTRARPSR
jgi:hypothetical protein